MPETLTRYQEFLANHLGIDSVTRTDLFRHELEGYGVDNIETSKIRTMAVIQMCKRLLKTS